MISFEEALTIVSKAGKVLSAEQLPFLQSARRILAEDIFSDINMPPFDKSAMDGFACKRVDLPGPLFILETIPAGQEPTLSVKQGQCSRIMTGSMLPNGADCVIKVEETQLTTDGKVIFVAKETANNICYQAEDVKKGQLVLKKGTLIKAAHIAVLASVGHTMPLVSRQVKAGILSTGDELVEPEILPATSQIRNSNASQMISQAKELGCEVQYYGIAPDEENGLLALIQKAMAENDLILLSGGVSMGDYDLVPPMLQKAGFEILFNKISVMPGSPTLFAKTSNCYCFGLPGNPVSSFVQFEMLAKPLIYRLMGHEYKAVTAKLTLGTDYSRRKANRMSLVPVNIADNGEAIPLEYHGSAHIHAYIEANGMLIIPIGQFELKKGEQADVRFL
ncbi:MAG: gephyrin-like molybdotransferase Glp [Bacteroidota bacterium]